MKLSKVLAIGIMLVSPAAAFASAGNDPALPCNALCRQWMGLQDPAEAPPVTPAAALELHAPQAAAAEPAITPVQPNAAALPVAPARRTRPHRPLAAAQEAAVLPLPPPRPRMADARPAPRPIASGGTDPVATALPAAAAPPPAPLWRDLAPLPDVPKPEAVMAVALAASPAAAAPVAQPAPPMRVAQSMVTASPVAARPVATPTERATPAPLAATMPPAFDVIAAVLLTPATR